MSEFVVSFMLHGEVKLNAVDKEDAKKRVEARLPKELLGAKLSTIVTASSLPPMMED